jgi:hypothetical protein
MRELICFSQFGYDSLLVESRDWSRDTRCATLVSPFEHKHGVCGIASGSVNEIDNG